MITVSFYGKDGWCTGFLAEGHADYGPRGQDIVCAAVSALTQGAILSTIGLTEAHTETSIYTSGRLRLHIFDPNENTQLLMEGLKIGLNDLQKQYPENVCVCHE